ncbi:MAG: 2-oxoacid:acceptor oxidoreductase family protein [Candidatus Hydrogenedentes bacterium]|nr:2-oxoacid:acceptor oxidoreductase family protein [Candidatus Hydrogenedentota bacterium]
MDGNTAVIMCERESTDGAGAYPITPSTQMGEYWAEAAAAGHVNISGRPLIFIEPEGEHAAAAVTAGLSMTGLRAANFSSGQGIAYMHESLYAAVGKRLTYVLNMGCRAMTKATLNVHAGHDDYHCIDDTGFFQVFGKSGQEVCDLNIIAHKIAELSLNPGIVAQDGFLTTHLIESMMVPERELIREYLGSPSDIIDTPTPAQRIIFGSTRRRIPEVWDVDNPVMVGVVQNQDSYMQSVAAQRPFFFDHINDITEQAMEEFYKLTGRRYSRVATYRMEDAEYVILGQGSVVSSAEAVADYLRQTRGIKVGVVNMTMFRPFPGDLVCKILAGRKGVAVLERTDQPLAEDLPLIREIRAAIGKSVENGRAGKGASPFPDHPVYRKPEDVPPLYSGSFGLGSRDLQPEGLIAAIENMIEGGAKKRFYYLSVDFVRDKAYTPKQEIYQQEILDGYPRIKDLAIRGSENPNLMPKDCITVRMHSIGGWGAITTGKNLAMTLFDLLNLHVKANPKYGSEKKGQPTTYYLSAAPEPIRINCEYFYVDVVLSPDPNVFHHSNPLAGLKKGGVFIIQSDLETAEAAWQSIPQRFQQIIIDNNIRVFYLDAFKIAREEAGDPELQFRMQGIAFQGAFFAASHVMEQAKLTEETLFKAIRAQLEKKFGGKGARVVEGNIRVVQRGFVEVKEITEKRLSAPANGNPRTAPLLPAPLKELPAGESRATDIHRFWEQTGNFYVTGRGNDNIVDPFIGLSMIPVATGVFRDMTQIRFEHPNWVPENCTACGKCYTVCPDSAISGLVNSVAEVFEAVIKRVEKNGHAVKQLRAAVRSTEKILRARLTVEGERADVNRMIRDAVADTPASLELDDDARTELDAEFEWFLQELGDFRFSISKPYFLQHEKIAVGSGGLLSITVDPYACKGCNECVRVCEDDALRTLTQSAESTGRLTREWDFWQSLPTTSPEYIRIESLDEKIGALETLLLDKSNFKSIVGGDGACLGCGEKTVVHLFTATVEALMQPRVKKQVERIDALIKRLETHIRLKMADTLNLSDITAIDHALDALCDKDVTLSNLSASLDSDHTGKTIDADWLKWVAHLLDKLRLLKWQYTEGVTKRGRARMGMINSTGCTSVWASTYPFNPYPFPWANHLFQDSTSMAMGVFEGHMAKMAEGFKAIRMAELELAGEYHPVRHDEFFTYFNWQQFTEEEFHLCPPVVAVGGDGSMYDIGFQNLSRMMMTGKPVKVLVLDTQVYSNTGGQACTSGFMGQISDMAQYGKATKGKEEIRKEIGLIGMAHRTTYILQGTMSNTSHLIEGFIDGLNARRPALFNIYAPCMPEHGIGDDVAQLQSKLAVESRAYPVYRYNPDRGITPAECFDLEANPEMEVDWPTYKISYVDETGSKAELQVPMTFADFAVTEGRFRKQFRTAPRDTWNENMVPLHEFIEIPKEERAGKFPFIWAVDKKQKLIRVIPSQIVVNSCEERRNFWRMLKAVAGIRKEIDPNEIAQKVRVEMVGRLASRLMELAGGGPMAAMEALIAPAAEPAAEGAAASAPAPANAKPAAPAGGNGYVAPHIDSAQCTACDECMKINAKIFAYNDQKKAYIKDPKGGPYRDLVRAAEKCTAQVIHPGMPADRSEKDIDKLIKRAKKYQ